MAEQLHDWVLLEIHYECVAQSSRAYEMTHRNWAHSHPHLVDLHVQPYHLSQQYIGMTKFMEDVELLFSELMSGVF